MVRASAAYPARFERRRHRVVCRRCGRTEDAGCVVGEEPCLEQADDHGFAIDEAEVIFWGLCPACTPPQR